jgi:hypothetical protein
MSFHAGRYDRNKLITILAEKLLRIRALSPNAWLLARKEHRTANKKGERARSMHII